MLVSDVYRNKRSGEIIYPHIPSVEDHRSDIEPNFQLRSQLASVQCDITSCCVGYMSLLGSIDRIFGLSLDGCRPAFHFCKMYSIRGK